jgi:hypothetical protein
MTKRITAHLTIQYVPLPADKYFAYVEGMRLLAEIMLARKQSHPAEDGSEPGCSPQPGQIHPWAGVTNPPDSPFEAPAGQTSSALLAETTTSGSTNHCSAG